MIQEWQWTNGTLTPFKYALLPFLLRFSEPSLREVFKLLQQLILAFCQ